jgi:hypothetical protein
MNNKLVILGALVLGLAIGRYSLPAKIETKVVEVEKKQTETDRDKHKETTTVTKELPDGTKETTTKTTEDTNTKRTAETNKTSESESTRTYGGAKTTISVLGGITGVPGSVGGPIYGLSVTKNILGPIVGGAFGLTNGTVGVSLGLEF